MLILMPVYLVIKCVRDCFILISSIGVDVKTGRYWEVIKDVGQFVWGKVRDPFFAIVVWALAFFGLFCPFEGRKHIAAVEREWHYVNELRDPDRRIHYHECRNNLQSKDPEEVPGFFSRHYYFLVAYCFQPHGNVSDTRYHVKDLSC